MSKASDIILMARETLADPLATRWSDGRLLRLLDEAQKDICYKARLLRAHTSLPVFEDIADYYLPKDALLLDKVYINKQDVPLVGAERLDLELPKWQLSKGTPKGVVFDKQNRNKLRLYPIPSETSSKKDTEVEGFGVITEGNSATTITTAYGITTGIVGTEVFMSSVYGEAVDISKLLYIMDVYYIQTAPDILSLDDELVVDAIFNKALRYYITGRALRDDMDTQNRQVGNEELQFYVAELQEAMKDSASDYTNSITQYTTTYRTGF